MSLREEIERQIKYDASDHPAVAAFFKTGTVPIMDHGSALAWHIKYIEALHSAILRLSEEIDGLKIGASEGS